jgi:hypothetical protein
MLGRAPEKITDGLRPVQEAVVILEARHFLA